MPRRSSSPAVTVPKDLNDRHQEALQLENQLEAALTAKNDRLVNTCRMRLCEILSDWIMTSPATALQFDAVGRLWKLCFYGRIGPARAKLLKAKRKQNQNSSAVSGAVSAAAASPAQQQERLQAFLAEGVTLLDFLCDKLIEQLTDHSSDKAKTGVVPCLQRLYIHLGDLFRYGSHYNKALKAYELAAKLAPAQGHAYNQLAVTTQVQDPTEERRRVAITVYWYVRSLAAHHDPFVTAMTNLKRLLQQNRQWLQQQQLTNKNKTSSTTTILAGQMSRNFFATFCDLQYDFLFPSEEQQQVPPQNRSMVECTSEAFELLKQLLASSALGEGLLCKLVAISAFSQWHCKKCLHPNHRAAHNSTLLWGTCLAERVAEVMQNKNNKSSKNSTSNVRGLGPLLLLTEFVLSSNHYKDDEDETSETFWKAVIQVYNLVQSMNRDGITAASSTSQPLLLPEYQQWQGFAPFAPFIVVTPQQTTPENSNNYETEDAYISDAEAVALLQLKEHQKSSQQQTSQQSSIQSHRTNNSGNDCKSNNSLLRVQRFLTLPFLDVVPRIRRSVDGHNFLQWEENSNDRHTLDVANSDCDVLMIDDTNNNSNHTNNQDFLVYQQTESGGPALLVPVPHMLQDQHQRQEDPTAANKAAAPSTTPTLWNRPLGPVHPQLLPLDIYATTTSKEHVDPVLRHLLPLDNCDATTATGTATTTFVPPPSIASQVRTAVMPPPGFGQTPTTTMTTTVNDTGMFMQNGEEGRTTASVLDALRMSDCNSNCPRSFSSMPAMHAPSNGPIDNGHFYSLFANDTTTSNPFAAFHTTSSKNSNNNNSGSLLDDSNFWGTNYSEYSISNSYQHATASLGVGDGNAIMGGRDGVKTPLSLGLLDSLLFDHKGESAEGSSSSQKHHGSTTSTTKNPFAA